MLTAAFSFAFIALLLPSLFGLIGFIGLLTRNLLFDKSMLSFKDATDLGCKQTQKTNQLIVAVNRVAGKKFENGGDSPADFDR